MKLIPHLLLVAALPLSVGLGVTPPDSVELDKAFVTIPYSELRALWEAGYAHKIDPEKAAVPAPVAHLLHRADLQLTLGERAGALVAEFEFEALAADWQSVPLLSGDAWLDRADAQAVQILWRDGYSALTNKAGKTQAKLHFQTRGAKSLTPENPLRLKLGNATVKRLLVSGIPAGLEPRVNGSAATETKDGSVIFLLASEAGEVLLQLAAPRIEQPPKPPVPSQWQTPSQTLVRYSEGRLHFQSRIFAHTEEGSGLELFLTLPASANGITATGDDLAESVALRLDDGRRVLRARWKTADVLDRELVLSYAVPQSPLAEQWTLTAASAPEHEGARHLFAILPAEGLELAGDGLRAPVESHRLPQWMREEIASAAFVTAESGPVLTLQARWLPVIATAEATVSEATCQLRLVADGSLHTTAAYAIQHQTPLAWSLELPAGVELLSCSVAGRTAHPIQRANGALEIPLPAPQETSKTGTQVALVYAAKTKALDPVSGSVALELPRTPLFIERLDWAVAVPGEFEITAVDGNVAVAAPMTATPDANVIALRKDLCRAERPAVELFYQRRTLEK